LIRLSGNRFHIHIESRADAQPFAVLHTKGLYEDKRTTLTAKQFMITTRQTVVWKQSQPDKKPDAKTLSFNDPCMMF
jgi:hypothetical protein